MSATLRPPTDADVTTVVGLMSDGWPEPTTAATLERMWTSPGIDLELDARVEQGAYVLVEDFGNGSAWIDVRGRPSSSMLDWAEERARAMCPRVLSGGWSSNQSLLHELERRGYELVRHSQRMEVDLEIPPPAATWPEGVEVRTFRPGDETLFHSVQQSLEEWTHRYIGSPRFVPELWLLATAGTEPAGFAICHPHPGNAALGWVGELGVLRPFRRQGVGRVLLLHAFALFRERGLRRAGLSVDSTSPTGANRLYEQAGMRVAARFDIYEKRAA